MKFNRNLFILLGLAAHVLAAIFSIGAHQCDEIFQIYEFAGYKMGINTAAELPWEFPAQMRSGIQPFIVYAITKGFHSMSVMNPFTISMFIRCVQSLFSFLVMLRFLRLMEKEMRSQKHMIWLYAFSLLFWCLPYLHARFNSENFSATLFLLGFVMIMNGLQKPAAGFYFAAAGFLFGIAFEARFQTCFMIIGLFAWLLLIRKAPFKLLLSGVFGMLLAGGVGLLADYWLYDQWVLSWWNYLDLNLFQDKASNFGREPFYYFISEALLQLIPPFSLIIIIYVVAFWIRFKTHVITWITLPFVLLHFFVAHKELRFLFPVLNFLPFMILYYFQSVENYPNRFVTFMKTKFFVRFAVVVNVLILFYYMFKPADNNSLVLKKVDGLTSDSNIVVWYEGSNPFTKAASLNYFHNPLIKTLHLKKDSASIVNAPNVYFFAETFDRSDLTVRHNAVFVKQYSSFPAWFKYLDFNGWVGRSDPFSIYKIKQP